ncbi:MAG: hypothetical protein ACRD21_05285 [Vicinamibacteria bacterium]
MAHPERSLKDLEELRESPEREQREQFRPAPDFERAVYLGGGPRYGAAREAALKMLEMTDGEIFAGRVGDDLMGRYCREVMEIQ